MISRTTKQFWKLYEALPLDIQERANKAYASWQSNPTNPGLHFKCVDPVDPIYSSDPTLWRGRVETRF